MVANLDSDFSLCVVLEYLSLKENQLIGSLPLNINQLTNLRELSIGNNDFEGNLELPRAEKLGKSSY